MNLTITAQQLRTVAYAKLAPGALEALASAFNAGAAQYGLDQLTAGEPRRTCQFWAQWSHESGGFRYTREIWGPTPAQRRYEGRADLGNTQTGDGQRFAGHGLPQVTGRANHREFTRWARARYPDAPDFEAQPLKLCEYPWALVACFWYWDTRRLNTYADRGDVITVTERINGGRNGLADRKVRLALLEKALSTGVTTALAPVPARDADARPTLRRGSRQVAAVYTLQKLLGIASDGVFGRGTEAAVLAYQRARHLLPDGVVGPGTWAVLYGDGAPAPAA